MKRTTRNKIFIGAGGFGLLALGAGAFAFFTASDQTASRAKMGTVEVKEHFYQYLKSVFVESRSDMEEVDYRVFRPNDAGGYSEEYQQAKESQTTDCPVGAVYLQNKYNINPGDERPDKVTPDGDTPPVTTSHALRFGFTNIGTKSIRTRNRIDIWVTASQDEKGKVTAAYLDGSPYLEYKSKTDPSKVYKAPYMDPRYFALYQRERSYQGIGYDPETNLPAYASVATVRTPLKNEDGTPMLNEKGQPRFNEKSVVEQYIPVADEEVDLVRKSMANKNVELMGKKVTKFVFETADDNGQPYEVLRYMVEGARLNGVAAKLEDNDIRLEDLSLSDSERQPSVTLSRDGVVNAPGFNAVDYLYYLGLAMGGEEKNNFSSNEFMGSTVHMRIVVEAMQYRNTIGAGDNWQDEGDWEVVYDKLYSTTAVDRDALSDERLPDGIKELP